MTTKSNNKANSNPEPSIGSWSGNGSTASQSNHFTVSNVKYDPYRLKLILMLEAQQICLMSIAFGQSLNDD
jgi:hypothetical protein